MKLPLIAAEKIIGLLDESGATEAEKLAALEIARCLVPHSIGGCAQPRREGAVVAPEGS